MPHPIPVPVRRALFHLWQQGDTPSQIADQLGLSSVTVRRLVRRFRQRGADAVAPDYTRSHPRSALDSDVARDVVALRREHPTWGAGVIRMHLLEEAPSRPVPATRTLQRWLLQADLAPAPAGRRPQTSHRRATTPLSWGRRGRYQIIPTPSPSTHNASSVGHSPRDPHGVPLSTRRLPGSPQAPNARRRQSRTSATGT